MKKNLYLAFIALGAIVLNVNAYGFGLPGVGDLDPRKAAEDMAKSKVAEAKGKAASKAKGAMDGVKGKAMNKVDGATAAASAKIPGAGSVFP